MKKLTALIRSERGQSLPIIALVFIGLLALVGLAIDGGNLFMQRRRAQNAADAAALAGTRLIALGIQACDAAGNNNANRAALDTLIAATVNRYAEQNGISDTNGVAGDETNANVTAYYVDANETRLGFVGIIPQVPLTTAGVEVEVVDEHDTFFMLVVGIDTIPSSGQAMAMTGVVRQFPAGGGILPLAIPQQVIEGAGCTEGTWQMLDSNGEFCCTSNGTTVCPTDPGTSANAQRGWLNMNHNFNADSDKLGATDELNRTFLKNADASGCKDPPDFPGLAGYASGACPYRYPIIAGTPNYLDGDFIQGSTGASTTGMHAIYNNHSGQQIYVPVFDRLYTYTDMNDILFPAAQGKQAADPDDPGSGGGFASGASTWYYHIVGYTAAVVGSCSGGVCSQTLNGEFVKAVVAAGIVPTGFEATCQPMLHGVTLWE